jgi:hypothetical protein
VSPAALAHYECFDFRGPPEHSTGGNVKYDQVRDASQMFPTQPKPKVSTKLLRSAAKAANARVGEKGDAQDMAAMKAAMMYRKAQGEGPMTYAKGHLPPKPKAVPQAVTGYGQGLDKVASLGESTLAKQMTDDNERRTQSVLPEHVVEPKHVESQAQMAKEEMMNNDQEADSMLPEHNVEAAHKSQSEIRDSEIKQDMEHANAVMPTMSAKHRVQGLHLKASQADQAKSEEAAYAKRADAILPEHTKEKAHAIHANKETEEKYNSKHADAVVPEHNVEAKSRTRDQIRKSEEQYDAAAADAVVPEHEKEHKARTQAEIRKEEEQENAKSADAVVPEHAAVATQRLTIAQQEATEEKQMEESAGNAMATDAVLDQEVKDAKVHEQARQHALEEDVRKQRDLLQHSSLKKAPESSPSFSYRKLYAEELKKEALRSKREETKAHKDLKMEKHIESQIKEIEGQGVQQASQSKIREQDAEALNNQHISQQVNAITAAASGPRDVTDVLRSSSSALSRNMAAIHAANKHLDTEVDDITSGFAPVSKARRAHAAPVKKVSMTKTAPKMKKPEDIKSKTAAMITAAHKMEAARSKHLFNVYTQTTSTQPKSWAARSVHDNMAKAAARMKHSGSAAF